MTILNTVLLTGALSALVSSLAASGTGAQDQFLAYVAKYEQDYVRVPFDGSRVRELRRSDATNRYEAGLRQVTTMKYGTIDVHHRIHISLYTYSTQQARDSAFEGWLRRFSILGDPIPLDKDVQHAKSPPLFALVTRDAIVVLTTRCETARDEWERNIQAAESVFGTTGDTTLRVGCGGPVEWNTVKGTAPD